MLTTAFLFTFCGLLMAQSETPSQTFRATEYLMSINCSSMNQPVNQYISNDQAVPNYTTPVSDSGSTLSNMKPTGPPTGNTEVSAKPNGSVAITYKGQRQYQANLIGALVGYILQTTFETKKWSIERTSDGNLICSQVPPTDQVNATCNSEPSSPAGILGQLLGIFLTLLAKLTSLLQKVVFTLVPAILLLIQTALNQVLAVLTSTKKLPDGSNCTHFIKSFSTDAGTNTLRVVIRSTLSKGGWIEQLPSTNYTLDDLIPSPGSLCSLWLSPLFMQLRWISWINLNHPNFTMTNNLGPLANIAQQMPGCGKNIAVSKLVFVSLEKNHTLEITGNGISANLSGTFEVFAVGSDVSILKASAIISFNGNVTYENECYIFKAVFSGKGSLSFVSGQKECDMTPQAFQIFLDELYLKKTTLSVLIEACPIARWLRNGLTKFTIQTKCIRVDHLY